MKAETINEQLKAVGELSPEQRAEISIGKARVEMEPKPTEPKRNWRLEKGVRR